MSTNPNNNKPPYNTPPMSMYSGLMPNMPISSYDYYGMNAMNSIPVQTFYDVIILCYKGYNAVSMAFRSQSHLLSEDIAIQHMKYMALRVAIENAGSDAKVSDIKDVSDYEKHNHRYIKIQLNGKIFVEGFVHNVYVGQYNVKYRGYNINCNSKDNISIINEANPYDSDEIHKFETDFNQYWYYGAIYSIDMALEKERVARVLRLQMEKERYDEQVECTTGSTNAYNGNKQVEGIKESACVCNGRKLRQIDMSEFYNLVKRYRNKEIKAGDAAKILGISESTFYKRLKESGL